MHYGCFAKSKVVVDKPRRVLSPLVQHSFQSYFLTLQSLIPICNTSVVMNSSWMRRARKKHSDFPRSDPFLSFPIFGIDFEHVASRVWGNEQAA